MKQQLIKYLYCPSCKGDLKLSTDSQLVQHQQNVSAASHHSLRVTPKGKGSKRGAVRRSFEGYLKAAGPSVNGTPNNLVDTVLEEILEGNLICTKCSKNYFIQEGVPIFTREIVNPKVKLTAKNFAYSWQNFSRINMSFYKKQFFDWISPVNEDFLKDKFVLDAGCGKGHHLLMISSYVKEAIGVDISNSAFIAYNNIKHLSNIHIIQADLNNLPLKDELFDYIYSVGVVHHTESPKETTKNLYKKLKPNGKISIWVYGRENNLWIIYLINPIRNLITKLFPPQIIHVLSFFIALFLYPILKAIYFPASKYSFLKPLQKLLFYYPYLSYISNFDFIEINNIIFDHLVAPISHYMSKEEVNNTANFNNNNINIEWHNQNSWRVLISKK